MASSDVNAATTGERGHPARPDVGARDVIFTFSYVTWIGAWRRGMHFPEDRLAQTLLTHPRVRRLTIANPYRSLPVYLVRSVLGERSVPFPASERVRLHQPLRIRRRDPTGVRALEGAYSAYDRRLERIARHTGMERPIIITLHPMIAGFAPLEWADAVTFYAWDDWTSALLRRRWWEAYEHAYARVREHKRRVCAVSELIVERIAPTGPSRVIPNGVEPSEWMDVSAPPSWFTSLPAPRILYVGTLDSRLDIECISETSKSFRHGSVVLVGRAADAAHLRPLRELRNVHVHPRVSRDEVARLITGSDVCVVPHVRTPFTLASSPLKVYEYLAGGKPVAATDLPPIRGIDPRVVLAPDGRDFPEAVRRALALGPAAEAERESFIARNSWRRRHDQLLDLALA